jgi:regulator of protease activity HflC (stomatin/prohibitin superfamily)
MESELPIVVGIIGAATILAAALLGYLSERSALGASMLAGFAAVAGGLCTLATVLSGWVGLLVAILLVTLLAYQRGKKMGKERGAGFAVGLWLGYCGSCAFGYWAAGWLGLLTITLPAWLTFWGALFGISRCLLPLKDSSQWTKAFRSLVTFSLGTNYPYHVLEERELAERVAGNPFSMFFAGPGIVLTGPAHAPVIWTGLQFKRVGEPGLNFTERFEAVYQTVDLRTQLRAFPVEAITKDGIRVRILSFFPFRLHAKGQEPRLGTSFPLDEESIFRAVREQPVEEGQKLSWDDLVSITATRILRKIISEYRFDELCEPFDPTKDPRLEIRAKLVDEVRAKVQPHGIEIIGGGIGNILPSEPSLVEQRVNAWRAEWERKISVIIGEAQANAIWEIERAHVEAQTDLIAAIRQVVEQRPGINPDVLANMAALRFIEALEEMACSPNVRKAVPDDTSMTLDYVRRMLK